MPLASSSQNATSTAHRANTGTLHQCSRDEAKALVKRHGGQVATSLSQRVTDVVIGDKAGSKQKKAEALGLRLLSEADFFNLIGAAT